ncbi:MAG: NAD(P)-dependent oxidoreductase [Oceanospirillaceae bacterium]|nr:NAD(P)-dependent oxidoreductase [Oceanospirillaceae bacterium]MCP5350625.1 NAD(P)-dependent oxidoreductase [Oceanospirillaceae bacterium]
MQIGFIGLGNMGYPMAGHLQKAGYDITVFNRSPQKCLQWQNEFHGKIANTPAELHHCDAIISCVGKDQDILDLLSSPHGLIAQCKSDTLFIDHTTTSANTARTLAKLAQEHQQAFMDAPVSGGQQGAINGALTIMCGASTDTFNKAQPLLRHYAKSIEHMGENGAGQLTKMVNQICVAGLIEGLAEGIYFGQQAGLDMHKVMALLGNGAASSWQMINRHKTMLAGEYMHGFAVDHMHKDLNICLQQAGNLEIKLPVTAQVQEFYGEIQRDNGGRKDTSSLLERLQKQNHE